MENTHKRTCVSKNLAEKYEIINFVRENPSLKQKVICEKFNIKQSTLATYLQRKEKIISDYERSSSAFLVKRARKPSFENVDEALMVWYTEKRNSNLWIDGETLRLMATEFATAFGHENAKITSSWISRWKIRHGLTSKVTGADRYSVYEMLNQDWRKKILEVSRNWAPEDIFNVDETGLFWKLTPDQTLAFMAEPGDRVTVLVGASMVGEKLPLLVIGKHDKPQCFQGIRHIPLKYRANKKAWMTSDLFEEWLRELDKCLNRKIILIVGNSPAHTRIFDLSNIHLIFFPASSISCTQPMECGIIKNLKHIYKLKLAVKQLKAHDENVDFKFNLLDSLSLLKDAWDEVTADTIINCFCSAGFSEVRYLQDKHVKSKGIAIDFGNVFDRLCVAFSIPTEIKIGTFLAMDDNVEVTGNLTDSEIIEKLYSKHLIGDDSNRGIEQELQRVSPKDALLAAQTLQQYLRQHPSASDIHCSMSQQLLSFLENEAFTNAKQKNFTMTSSAKLTLVSRNKCFNGEQRVYSHDSSEVGCTMKFGIFLPASVLDGTKQPVLYWLSGLTCNEQNFITKAGAQRAAAKQDVIIVNPDTSPRGCNIEGEDDSYDFGTGAGFYVDATTEKWKKNYRMYSYITKELIDVIDENFPTIPDRKGIFGHGMGGHGALVCALKNPGLYRSVSAFAPIAHPTKCPWGKKCFTGYLGPDENTWREYDATELVKSYNGPPLDILVDQGASDEFLKDGQLLPERLMESCAESKMPCIMRMQEGYDHSYYFIATFIEDHIIHHAKRLHA